MTTPSPDLRTATVQWVSSLLDSASSDLIGATNWWPRATSALEAAATAPTYGEAVSVACRKLQIDTLWDKSADRLAALEPAIGPYLAEWAAIVHAELPYLIALTRIQRQASKNGVKK